MRKQFSVLLLSVLIVTGCSNINELEPEQKEPEAMEMEEETSYDNGAETANPTDNPQQILNGVKSIKVGSTIEEASLILGEKSVETVSAMDNSPLWRYDLGAENAYQFEGFLDEVDIEGLNSGAVKVICFLALDEQKRVTQVSAYYKENGNVEEYKLWKDRIID